VTWGWHIEGMEVMRWMASEPNQWVGLLFLIFVFPLWLSGMVTFVYFFVHVAPSAIRRWVDDEGYEMIQRTSPRFGDLRSLASDGRRKRFYGTVYRVTVRDRMGQNREGLVLVGGSSWFSISVSRCPVKVRWDGVKTFSQAPSHPQNKHLLWDREMD
jgi:hypothetical protein